MVPLHRSAVAAPATIHSAAANTPGKLLNSLNNIHNAVRCAIPTVTPIDSTSRGTWYVLFKVPYAYNKVSILNNNTCQHRLATE